MYIYKGLKNTDKDCSNSSIADDDPDGSSGNSSSGSMKCTNRDLRI